MLRNDIPAVAITFDYYADAFKTAFPILSANFLSATYFVDYRTVNNVAPGSAYSIGLQRDHLTQLKMNGWTIGAYSGDNLVDMFDNDRNAAMDFLTAIKTNMRGFGFEVQSLAPNQRMWSTRLRNVAVNLFKRVRAVSDDFSQKQPLPIPEPLYVARGGSPSLSAGDTASSLGAQLDDLIAQSSPCLWTIVVHKVGNAAADPTGFTLDAGVLSDFASRLQLEVAAGRIQVIGYDDIPVAN